ncbi:ankyrin repeat domain-containing protein [Bodo saltans virus]|uniref:Ankyrin repeat domain-containing protein n=1 Tax=Bodo saltans virus TaxID=2024608 RepID=A0A2H4UT98_9VIRU|nr:ankyrin repeat domain-containing protein [Bodo saltans virus]ATZ80161.1 ankyrin repeat domain-containing protein [Bodo saltans virus]
METDWIIHTKLYDNLKKEKSLDIAKLNNIIDKLIEQSFDNDLNELIMNEKIEILLEKPKICKFFEIIEFNEQKIKSIRNKFIAIKKERREFYFSDLYKSKNGELYDFYKNMKYDFIKKECSSCDRNLQHSCVDAAVFGHLGCLIYMHKNRYSWDENTCLNAAINGHLECLKYMHENGCRWDKTTCSGAAQYGHLECLKYAHENGCPWNKQTCISATGSYSSTCYTKKGRLECLKYAHENGCHWDKDVCSNAAQYGELECLKYAHENGCHWNENTCSNAAKYGHLECLKYAHENNCPWNANVCRLAAQNGHLECLKYARDNRCPE